MKELVDTNVILRYLVNDIPKQADQADQWFKEGKRGKRNLAIKPIVIGEVCFVLETYYHISRKQIAETLSAFLQHTWFDIEDRKALLLLWIYYVEGFHFVDSFLLALLSQNEWQLLTFDKKLNKRRLAI